MAGERERFTHVVRRELNIQGQSVKAAAQQLGIPAATLRTCLHRNRYPQILAVGLAELLGLPTDPAELLARYAFDRGGWTRGRSGKGQPGSLLEAFRVSDRRPPRESGDLNRFLAELGELIQAMRAGDLAVFASATVTPTEFESSEPGHRLCRRIAQAIKEGGRVLYLRPTEAVLQEYREVWRFRRLPPADEIDQEFREFQSVLARLFAEQVGGTEDAAAARVAAHVVQLSCDRSPFFCPGFIVGMLQASDVHHNLFRRMVIRTPGGFTGVVYRRADDVFDNRFSDFVAATIETELAAHPETGHEGGIRETLVAYLQLLDARFRARTYSRPTE